jgi:hypothetical protein
VVTGAGRTAEELGRAFPGTPVVVSGGAAVVETVPPAPALVVATPGAEPRADGGYAAAVLPPEAEVLGPIMLDGETAGKNVQNDTDGASGVPRADENSMFNGEEEADGVRPEQVRVLVRVPRSASMPLAAALRAAQGVRSSRKDAGPVRVQLDPAELI